MRLLLFVSLVLAVWRVTRLLIIDSFPPIRVVREWFISTFAVISPEGDMIKGRRLGGLGHALAYLWTCSWCMSVWAGGAVVAIADWRLSVPYPWLIVAVGSLVAGLGSQAEDEHEQKWKLRDLDIADPARRERR